MDAAYELRGVTFVWDPAKAESNKQKHGVACEEAAEAFFDPFVRVVDTDSEDESRDGIIGMDTRWNLLFVVHILFEDDTIRMISARTATRHERRWYED